MICVDNVYRITLALGNFGENARKLALDIFARLQLVDEWMR